MNFLKSLIYAVLGVVLLAVGIWWITAAGFTAYGILAALVTGVGGALLGTAVANFLDAKTPTSKKV